MTRSHISGSTTTLLVLSVLLLTGCRTTRPVEPSTNPDQQTEAELGEGNASFYAAKLNGQLTASGQRYDQTQLVAAHRTLPFGTCLKVERVDDGRTVEVTVIDRGPFVAGRIIDLSRAAAEQLGFIADGVTRVRLTRC
jgi:rare lipoprotein A